MAAVVMAVVVIMRVEEIHETSAMRMRGGSGGGGGGGKEEDGYVRSGTCDEDAGLRAPPHRHHPGLSRSLAIAIIQPREDLEKEPFVMGGYVYGLLARAPRLASGC